MKITKTFFGVFLLTFLIGYVSFSLTRRNNVPITITKNSSPELSAPIIEAKEELEIIEKVDDPLDALKYPFKMQLLETGEDFDDDDVIAANGETWLGLFKEEESYFLRPTQTKIIRTRRFDEKKQISETTKSLKVSDKSKPLFLLKNFNAVKEKSRIVTLFQGMTWSDILEHKEQPNFNSYEMLTKLNLNFSENYKIARNEYTLKVIEAKNKNNAEILALVLEGEGKRQIIHTVSKKESSDVGYLYWVGDLDSDGKPDFYLSLHETDNVSERFLFLSSKAGNGNLVRAVASFVTMANC